MPQLLSEYFGVSTDELEGLGAFDAFVDVDSRLHVDPHLLAESCVPEMQEARELVSRYFEDTISLLELCGDRSGPLWDQVVKRLQLSELKGVSLGYAKGDADGSAVGAGLARALAGRAFHIVKAGEKNPRIFELVGLFTDDYGADRISDVVLRISEVAFARYSARVAASLKVPTTTRTIQGKSYPLPYQVRHDRERPIFLIPKDVLRELPVALDRSEISAVAAHNEGVRRSLNELFASVGAAHSSPAKSDLWSRVAENPALLRDLVQAYQAAGGSPYDFHTDPAAEHTRFLAARKVAAQHPLNIEVPSGGWTQERALQAVVALCEHFKTLVEHNGLWDAFWIRKAKPEKALSERAMQRIFFGIALTYCKDGTPNLDISPEANAGPGPVDFKFSYGSAIKVTVEMKKSNHGRLLHGFETQLALYNRAERTTASVFLIVRTGDDRSKLDAVIEAQRAAIGRGEPAPAVVIIDARLQDSASKA